MKKGILTYILIMMTLSLESMPENNGRLPVDAIQNFEIISVHESGVFTIKANFTQPSNVNMYLSDPNDDLVFYECLGFTSGPLSKNLDLSSLSAGLYTIKLVGDAESKSRKILIHG